MEGTGQVVRIRLVFEDENILNMKQRSEGLKQCWIIVKPHLKIIAEIASDILHTFHLHRTCPYGLWLSLEGYTFPYTQPISILKDKDIVSVNKKRYASGKETLTIEEASIQGSETLGGRLHKHSGVKLLALDEFEKEAGGYQSENEDNGTNTKDDDVIRMEKLPIRKESSRKKRKQSELVRNSKLKDAVPDKPGNSLQIVAKVGGDEHIHRKRKKRRHSKEIPCDAVEDQNHTEALEVEVEDAEDVGDLQSKEKISFKNVKDKKSKRAKANRESDEFQQIYHMPERCPEREDDQVDVIGTATENASIPTERVKKFPSRSAKRKKAKRCWLREQKAKNQELVQSNDIVDKKLLPKSDKPQKSNHDDIEAEEEILPVVIRPGHIRFLPLDEEYESQEIQDSTPVLQWNGITTKRQGQNWGKEKNSCANWAKEPVCPREEANISSDDREEETMNKCPLNFDELPSLSGLPQQGDIIAYRLVELSTTSWCPELSCFRVGKIASYDCQSTKIRLVPVSEYPFAVTDSLGEEHAQETDISPYNEDGSLEIDFGSLVDVRWMHQQNSNSNTNTCKPYVKVAGTIAKCTNGERNSSGSADMNTGFPVAEEPTPATNANGDGENLSVWEEINQAFSSKKAELALKKDQSEPVTMDAQITKNSKKSGSKSTKEKFHISKQGSGTPTPRTSRSLRGSALGPTISLLRAQNILQ